MTNTWNDPLPDLLGLEPVAQSLALGDGFQLLLVMAPRPALGRAIARALIHRAGALRETPIVWERIEPYRHLPHPDALDEDALTRLVLEPLFGLRPITPPPVSTPPTLDDVIDAQDPSPAGPRDLVILDVTRAPHEEAHQRLWAWLFARVNERRNALVNDLGCALLFLLPPHIDTLVGEHAPDLWSIRSAWADDTWFDQVFDPVSQAEGGALLSRGFHWLPDRSPRVVAQTFYSYTERTGHPDVLCSWSTSTCLPIFSVVNVDAEKQWFILWGSEVYAWTLGLNPGTELSRFDRVDPASLETEQPGTKIVYTPRDEELKGVYASVPVGSYFLFFPFLFRSSRSDEHLDTSPRSLAFTKVNVWSLADPSSPQDLGIFSLIYPERERMPSYTRVSDHLLAARAPSCLHVLDITPRLTERRRQGVVRNEQVLLCEHGVFGKPVVFQSSPRMIFSLQTKNQSSLCIWRFGDATWSCVKQRDGALEGSAVLDYAVFPRSRGEAVFFTSSCDGLAAGDERSEDKQFVGCIEPEGETASAIVQTRKALKMLSVSHDTLYLCDNGANLWPVHLPTARRLLEASGEKERWTWPLETVPLDESVTVLDGQALAEARARFYARSGEAGARSGEAGARSGEDVAGTGGRVLPGGSIWHLSCPSATARGAYLTQQRSKALLRDLALMRERVGPPVALCISGGLTARAEPGAFQRVAREVIEPVLRALNLSWKVVCLVPGGRDVSREYVKTLSGQEESWRRTLNNPASIQAVFDNPRRRALVFERLAGYEAALLQIFADRGVDEDERLREWTTRQLELGGLSLGIACLNTAWRSSGRGEDDRGHMLIGRHQLNAALERLRGANFKVALMHHPPAWLAKHEEATTAPALFAAFDLVLHAALDGVSAPQVHDVTSMVGGAVRSAPGVGVQHYQIAGARLDAPGAEAGYSVIDLSSADPRLLGRRYDPERGVFTADTRVGEEGVSSLRGLLNRS